MSINTNGFITEYVKAVQNKEWLEKEQARLHEVLSIPRKKIEEIEKEFGVKDLENKLSDVFVSRRDTTNVVNYYYFRSIVDGIYNLLKEYGWKYTDETFNMLSQNFGFHYSISESFEIFYTDYITSLNPTCVLDLVAESITDHIHYYIKYEEDMYDYISIPTDLNIMFVLNETEKFLKDSVKLYEEKESDEEYKTYLRLKEKYEGKNK